jgi:hypothetical protein
MWAERYILVSEGMLEQALEETVGARGWTLEEAGRWKKRGDGCCD